MSIGELRTRLAQTSSRLGKFISRWRQIDTNTDNHLRTPAIRHKLNQNTGQFGEVITRAKQHIVGSFCDEIPVAPKAAIARTKPTPTASDNPLSPAALPENRHNNEKARLDSGDDNQLRPQ